MFRLPKVVDNPDLTKIKAEIVAQANADHAEYPQYRGHWAGPEWMLCRITREIKTKLGVAFLANEVTIGHLRGRIETGPYAGQISVTCYSVQNKCNTSIRERFVEWL